MTDEERENGFEQLCQAEAIRRLAIGLRTLYRNAGRENLWDLVVNASWPEAPRWRDVSLDPRGNEAIAQWKTRVRELLAEPADDPG
jgi:hypothetical protein